MPSERWLRIEQLFTEAVEQPASGRADFLAGRCGPLRAEVASLLAAAEQSADFLSQPALGVFAGQIAREGWSVQPGERIASYTVERRLGAGGMGEIWRARDERLGRDVAIKLLLPHPSDADQRVRVFQREAKAVATLNHPNVLTIHDVGDHGGAPYLVTECLEGESLRARLGGGPLTVDEALGVVVQVARGLGAAHGRSIVHRDLKPENIFLVRDGRVKILDFGLATLHTAGAASSVPPPEISRSLLAGTAGYMAPEQLRGEVVDGRADIFALGAVLYELLAGCGPFKRSSTLETLEAVLTLPPPALPERTSVIAPALSEIVGRCLAKSPDDRFATVAEVVSALETVIRSRSLPAPPGLRSLFRRPAVLGALGFLVVAVVAGGWRSQVLVARARWARTVAGPQAERLKQQGQLVEAYLLARRALDAVPDDPQQKQLWLSVSNPVDVTSDPPGAEVEVAPYRGSTASWFSLGRTPLAGVRVPDCLFRLRLTRPGLEPVEVAGAAGELERYRLDPIGAAPPGMVHVVGGRDTPRAGLAGDLGDFWIDRFEVTNRQFQAFVDQGGYARAEYWREPFVEGGRTLPFGEAVARFRDSTGRPGPSTWKRGHYLDGQADFPVAGVSWYEAAAYLSFAGKSLPTVHHWYRAAGLGRFDDVLAVSNFEGKGPATVGSYGGLGPFGTYDMVGNVKEWTSTEADAHRRTMLGGAWDEPRYMFDDDEARDPFERGPGYGFRGAKYLRPLSAAVVAPVRADQLVRDARAQKPIGDDVFAVYRRLYAYDRAPLNAVLESSEETEIGWRHTIAFDAANGGERMSAVLFLPKSGPRPYQTVVFFPPGDAFCLRSSRDMSLSWPDFITASGRAFLWPVYKGTFERPSPDPTGANGERERRITWSRELGRAIDYLETRRDIDASRLAFLGVSAGADAGVILAALEPRLKTAVLLGTGIWQVTEPEIDPLNYAPRVHIPTLMLNGRYDFGAPLETAQRALFTLLGAADKQHKVFQSGHAIPRADMVRETLSWLDRTLGPVLTAARR
jgi:predicted esterase